MLPSSGRQNLQRTAEGFPTVRSRVIIVPSSLFRLFFRLLIIEPNRTFVKADGRHKSLTKTWYLLHNPLPSTFLCGIINSRHKFISSQRMYACISILSKTHALFYTLAFVKMNFCRSNRSFAFFGSQLWLRTFYIERGNHT